MTKLRHIFEVIPPHDVVFGEVDRFYFIKFLNNKRVRPNFKIYFLMLIVAFYVYWTTKFSVLAETSSFKTFEEIANSQTLEVFQHAYRQLSWFDQDRLINYIIEKSSFFSDQDRVFLNQKYLEMVKDNRNVGYFGSSRRDVFLDFLYEYSTSKKVKGPGIA